eukprot:1194897-Prorocentrum_minimum.AAC.5
MGLSAAWAHRPPSPPDGTLCCVSLLTGTSTALPDWNSILFYCASPASKPKFSERFIHRAAAVAVYLQTALRRYQAAFPGGGRTFRGRVEHLDLFMPEGGLGGGLLAYATADGEFGVRTPFNPS